MISVRMTVFMYVWICCSSIVLWSSQPFIWIKRSPDTVILKHGRYTECLNMMYVIPIHVCSYACVCGSNSWPRHVSLGWPLQPNWIWDLSRFRERAFHKCCQRLNYEFEKCQAETHKTIHPAPRSLFSNTAVNVDQ